MNKQKLQTLNCFQESTNVAREEERKKLPFLGLSLVVTLFPTVHQAP